VDDKCLGHFKRVTFSDENLDPEIKITCESTNLVDKFIPCEDGYKDERSEQILLDETIVRT